MKILVVNAGSSSHKFSLFDLYNEEPVEALWEGEIDWRRGAQSASLCIKSAAGTKIEKNFGIADLSLEIKNIFNYLWEGKTKVIEGPQMIEIVGHRVVHGGEKFVQPTFITPEVKQAIKELIPLAPLHNRANEEGIELMEQLFPLIPQVAVFDTAFHLTMPEMIKTYPLPWQWKEKGIQRYGFHGISHQYCAEKIVRFLGKEATDLKIINCHLGNGCSLCAIKAGKSYETTMGFTPLEGLMMGTRCGSIDPGILLYLMREHQTSLEDLERDLNFMSGLKGIGGSSDMRELLERQEENQAKLAVDMFIHRLISSIGSLAVSLGGFNVLNFTGGIGEHSALIRERVCMALSCLNVSIDREKNRTTHPDFESTALSSKVNVLVLHTREEWMIARACLQKLNVT